MAKGPQADRWTRKCCNSLPASIQESTADAPRLRSPQDYPSGARLLALSREKQVQAVIEAARQQLLELLRGDPNYKIIIALREQLKEFMRKKLPFEASELASLTHTIADDPGADIWSWPLSFVLRAVEIQVESEGLSDELEVNRKPGLSRRNRKTGRFLRQLNLFGVDRRSNGFRRGVSGQPR